MFASAPAFSAFSVRDIEEARQFYGDTLGLATEMNPDSTLRLTLGTGAHVMLYPKDNHEPATYTALMFPVPDIHAAVADITSRGLTLEHLDGVGEDGIMPANVWGGPANAWIKDPSGNWISIFEDPSL